MSAKVAGPLTTIHDVNSTLVEVIGYLGSGLVILSPRLMTRYSYRQRLVVSMLLCYRSIRHQLRL